jgi:SAM-dependent methyltransferase
MTDLAAHWENVYATKDPTAVSWYRPHLERSLAFIEAASLAPGSRVLDVGGGASTLVDDLVARGGLAVTVLDLSASALARARERLGDRAAAATFVAGDVLSHVFSQGGVDLWHDRAVLHFLREEADRMRYREQLLGALAPGGHVVLGGFAPDGPEKCSGLPVNRAGADELMAWLGAPFEELGRAAEVHVTPWASDQSFAYVHARRRPA